MADLEVTTIEAIARLGGLDLDQTRTSSLAVAAAPVQQMLRDMTDAVDLGETPPAGAFKAEWE